MTTVSSAPRFTIDAVEMIAANLYGFDVSAVPLPGERDQNFRLRTALGDQFVLKIANPNEQFEFLDCQNEMIEFLAAGKLDLQFPRIHRSNDGKKIATATWDGEDCFVRLLTWIDGACLAEAGVTSRKLLSSLGRALAQMDSALTQFSHPAAHRSFHWDLRNAAGARKFVPLLPAARQALVNRFFDAWKEIDWSLLRFSIIHNDANDYNVLVNASHDRVRAILDYGDTVYSATVCNLAIALAYVMLDKPAPIEAAACVVAAYHETYPLTEPEIDALFTLSLTRLGCSVCFAAEQTRAAPDNEYLNISNAPAWRLLEKLSHISPKLAKQMFRFSCGLPLAKSRPSKHTRTSTQLLAARRRHLGPSLSISYREPLHIVAASRQYLYDADSRRYLDCVNNVAHVGHSHPRVVQAASEQMMTLNTNTRYLHPALIEYSERLVQTLPDSLDVVYLVNSGSEANELALRLARAHTGRSNVIVVESAYHGNTSAMIELSPYKYDGPGGRGRSPLVQSVPMPDVFRGAHRGAGAGNLYARDVAECANELDGRLAAFFCESALSCGGQIILPQGFLAEAFQAVRNAGGVCVADEVQTGFGRAGTHFWMFQTQNVVPDIVTLGKPIGNGHPLGAVITTREIAASFANGMEYFNTFAGNPVSCAAGLAVLDVIRDEELQQNALEVGEYLKVKLDELRNKHELIGDVRGLGLFAGIELVRDRGTLEPADTEANQVVELMKTRGVLLSTDGPFHNVIKLKPPMIFSRRDADCLVSNLDSVLHGI